MRSVVVDFLFFELNVIIKHWRNNVVIYVISSLISLSVVFINIKIIRLIYCYIRIDFIFDMKKVMNQIKPMNDYIKHYVFDEIKKKSTIMIINASHALVNAALENKNIERIYIHTDEKNFKNKKVIEIKKDIYATKYELEIKVDFVFILSDLIFYVAIAKNNISNLIENIFGVLKLHGTVEMVLFRSADIFRYVYGKITSIQKSLLLKKIDKLNIKVEKAFMEFSFVIDRSILFRLNNKHPDLNELIRLEKSF